MKPVWKWVIGIVVAILIIILGVAWYFSRNWKPIVETKLQEMIHDSTDGLYSLRYDDLKLNVALGNVTLTNAELIPDSAVYRQLVDVENAPNNRFHIQLSTLKIRRFGIWDMLINRKLNINNIVLESPAIHMIYEHHAFNDTIPEDKQSKTLYENIKEVFNAIHVKNIELNNVGFKYSTIEGGKSTDMKLDSVQINIKDVLIDETAAQDTSRIFYTKLVDVFVPGFEYDFPDGYYRAKFGDLRVNTSDRHLLLTKVAYAPKMSKAAFFKQRNQNITMAVLNFDTIKFEGLDFKKLIDDQETVAKSLLVKKGSVSLYNDLRYPKKKKSHVGRGPHQQLMQLDALVNIDTVHVDNVDILYGETSGTYHQEGVITFNAARGIITNVTNDSTALAKDKYMRADLRTRIMNSGNLHAQFGFDMLSKNGAHTYKGSLGAMQATAFNRILKPLLNVEIGSGNVRKVTFDMQATDHRNWGDFRFDYDNLKIRLLGEKDEEGNRSNRRVLSFLVNQIIINDSNPDANEKYHIGKINYRRVPEYTFWKTLWQSLLEGIKQTAGISPEREARLMGTAQTAQSTVEGTKNVIEKTGSFFKGLFKKKDNEEKQQ